MIAPLSVYDGNYWRLTQAVAPGFAETLNRHLAMAMGGDGFGWDLAQISRSPGTPNLDYTAVPTVWLARITNERHDPEDLDRLLPTLPENTAGTAMRKSRKPKARLGVR